MSDVLSALTGPGLTQALYAGNALWFSSAVIHFGFRQAHVMRRISHRKTFKDPAVRSSPSGDKWHHDILAYLGGMNSPLVLLSILRLYSLLRPSRYLSSKTSAGDVPLDITALTVLGLANFSQAILNFTLSRNNDRWIMGKGLDRITVLDAVFTVLDWSFALARVVTN
ncbi:hypothetical protein F4813DRAFT_388599 [Daldinia decipiens]|uniref:uncharacterized protein n=1 Tax=Daldinia decipiens TaxID=326647 RepID=UPI0020C3E882|nr:uncharacterized protein F4813DRAFT_388599 [Daldinia decipiens]KAI1658324.1 hypothetical protein F4813DRAFT_388599 [Daldinia decipiens]